MAPPVEVSDNQQELREKQILERITTNDPKVKGLTEYSTTPSPPSGRTTFKALVPPDLQQEDGYPDYLKLILLSKVPLIVKPTPCGPAPNLSKRLGAKVILKREDLQPVFSFKIRGAFNKIANLTPEERAKGVIACSAGNHAQGVAMSAKHFGIRSVIVMPEATPSIKVKSVERYGGEPRLYGQDFDAAKAYCKILEVKEGMTNIPPFDDPYIIAGQGTIGMEIASQCDVSELKAVFVGVGGGGMIAGIATYLKRLVPHVKIIGVETEDANALKQSMDLGERVTLAEVGLFADGAAVKQVGEEPFRLCQKYVDEVVEVTTDELCAAIQDVYTDTRSIVEPAGALAVAGLKKYLQKNKSEPNGSYCAVLSGANMDFNRLRFVADRAPLGDSHEALLSVNIPERPGTFLEMMQYILPRPVTEFSYRYAREDEADIFMSVRFEKGEEDIRALLDALNNNGMKARDISNNELAKSHMRYLIGGKAVPNERLFRFSFPERPGALRKFLEALTPDCNISLFHYRNHGGDIGKILCGVQVSEERQEHFEKFLKELHYPFVEETDNEVYRSFITHTP